jgi:hypothetical protein
MLTTAIFCCYLANTCTRCDTGCNLVQPAVPDARVHGLALLASAAYWMAQRDGGVQA